MLQTFAWGGAEACSSWFIGYRVARKVFQVKLWRPKFWSLPSTSDALSEKTGMPPPSNLFFQCFFIWKVFSFVLLWLDSMHNLDKLGVGSFGPPSARISANGADVLIVPVTRILWPNCLLLLLKIKYAAPKKSSIEYGMVSLTYMSTETKNSSINQAFGGIAPLLPKYNNKVDQRKGESMSLNSQYKYQWI